MAAMLPSLTEIEEAVRRIVREELRRAAPETMTVEQAAGYTGRAPKTVRGWILAGLPATRKGRRLHLRREDLDAWLARAEPTHDALVASLRRTG